LVRSRPVANYHGGMSDDLDDLFDGVIDEPKPAKGGGSGYDDATETQPAVDRENTANLEGDIFQEVQREGYRWAQDCFWVYKRVGRKLTKAEAGPGRWALYQEAKRDLSNFVGQILPKAMAMLEKARDKAGDTDLVEKTERKEIAKLQEILVAAREEAAEMTRAGTL
jgi:hypothetical protein